MCKDELLHNEENREYINIQTGEVLDLERVSQLKDNAMLKVNPHLWIEWDFEKNDELGYDIWKMTKGINGYKVWWKCLKCNSGFDMNINNRHHNNNCPFCAGKRVNYTNSLASINPKLVKEWHPTKNGSLKPHDVTVSSNKKVWWLGECGHEWSALVSDRNLNRGCPYCSSDKLLEGFNDMWTTNPELAKLLMNPEDGYKYMQNSHAKLDWKCPKCGETVKDKDIRSISSNGVPCPNCSDGIYYPEKVVYYTLKELNIDFTWQKTFEWAKNKRYDFYIDNMNVVIEVHGGQHSVDKGFERSGWQSIEEVKTNDIRKLELAIENGIKLEGYVVIDAKYSDFKYIKESIMKSNLSNFYDLTSINWESINLKSSSSMVLEASDLWNSKKYKVKEIGEILKIGRNKVARLLNKGHELGLCVYDDNAKKGASKSVVQLTIDNRYIHTFNSLKEACIKNNFSLKTYSSIGKCCQQKQTQAKGYKWMYLKDYEKMINNLNEIS